LPDFLPKVIFKLADALPSFFAIVLRFQINTCNLKKERVYLLKKR
jgi:hypothetical protein